MNVGTSTTASTGSQWEWNKPSPWLFIKSVLDDARTWVGKRPWQAWRWYWQLLAAFTLIAIPPTFYAFRYVLLHPLFQNLRIYAMAIGLVAALAATSWYGIRIIARRWLPEYYAKFVPPIGAVLAALLMVMGASAGKDLHAFLGEYWRYQTLDVIEPKVDPLTDHERIWSLDGIHTFVRRQMRDTETPTKPHLVRDGTEYVWTMGIEPTTAILQYKDPVDEVITIPATVSSFELQRDKRVYFDSGEKLWFSRNIYTCTQRRLWFWQAASNQVTRQTIYIKNDAGKLVQVVPIKRWAGWFFPRPEFGGVMVVDQTGPSNWLGERWKTIKRVFWGCGTWIGPDEIARHPFLVGQNLVPFEVTRYMAASLRFRNGFWAPTWLRREGDIRIADMPDDQNEQPFTLFFHVRNDEGKIVSSKLYQYVALEPYDAAHQGHAAEFLGPADGIGKARVFQFFGERESLTGVTAVAGWVRSSKRNYDWDHNLPNEHRPYIKDLPDSNGVVKARRMWLTAVVTIDKKKYEAKDPKGFITGAPEIVITDARKNGSVWVGKDPHKWPDELQSALGAIWTNEKPKKQ